MKRVWQIYYEFLARESDSADVMIRQMNELLSPDEHTLLYTVVYRSLYATSYLRPIHSWIKVVVKQHVRLRWSTPWHDMRPSSLPRVHPLWSVDLDRSFDSSDINPSKGCRVPNKPITIIQLRIVRFRWNLKGWCVIDTVIN